MIGTDRLAVASTVWIPDIAEVKVIVYPYTAEKATLTSDPVGVHTDQHLRQGRYLVE